VGLSSRTISPKRLYFKEDNPSRNTLPMYLAKLAVAPKKADNQIIRVEKINEASNCQNKHG
jgi:hypothetical protein